MFPGGGRPVVHEAAERKTYSFIDKTVLILFHALTITCQTFLLKSMNYRIYV